MTDSQLQGIVRVTVILDWASLFTAGQIGSVFVKSVVKSIAGVDLYGEKTLLGVRVDPTLTLKLIRLSYIICNLTFLFFWMTDGIASQHSLKTESHTAAVVKIEKSRSSETSEENSHGNLLRPEPKRPFVAVLHKLKSAERSLQQRVVFLKWAIGKPACVHLGGTVCLYLWSAFGYVATVAVYETNAQNALFVLCWKTAIDLGNWLGVAWFLAYCFTKI
ncbi:hypothetical protein HDU91_001222 [Kappamyces sp. JEL0680]|nr:hypothetical protein HDU91_001222 [Kappamyces sp. JEL0680]